jgi:hypothetical protein
MQYIQLLFNVACYEFRMQVRRPAIWITMLLLGLLVFSGLSNPWQMPIKTPLMKVIVIWATVINAFTPIGLGTLLADRLPRDRKTRVNELLVTTASDSSARLFGKYLGSTFATIMPILLLYGAGIGYIVYRWQRLDAILLALQAFVTVNLPGLLFVGAFSIACTAVLWVPLYQFLFVGYWFWGNLLSPVYYIPTVAGTLLTPVGGYMASGYYGVPFTVMHATVWQGIESTALLLGIALCVMLVLWQYQKWEQARQ